MNKAENISTDPSPLERFINLFIRAVVGIGFAAALVWYFSSSYIWIYQIRETSGSTMGTTYYVKCYTAVTDDVWKKASQAVAEELNRIDAVMSTYKPDSEISRFNTSESTDWFPVSAETVKLIQLSQDVSRLTDGMFDITVGPLVDLWGFGAKRPRPQTAPVPEQIIQVKEHCGMEKLEIRLDPPAVRKTIPQLQMDLSAVAKGYSVDCVAALLETHGITSYMIEVGGENRTKGVKKDKAPWVLGILEPKLDEKTMTERPICEVVHLRDQAMATSGDYQNLFPLDGKIYAHIINPKTGFALEVDEKNLHEQIGSISVIDPSCARADALATGLYVLGTERGLAAADAENIPVLYILRTPNGKEPFRKVGSKAYESGGWRTDMEKKPSGKWKFR
jgi:thiamine biosynthesis lipoprotein